jgi:hypothetical protein
MLPVAELIETDSAARAVVQERDEAEVSQSALG